jgi:Flp pilus assembly protein TadG
MWLHRARGQRGAAVVDFVLVLVVVLPLFLGVVQLGLVLHVRNTLVSAASEGARYAATADRPLSSAVTKTRQQISTAIAGRFAERVTAAPAVVRGAPGVQVRVVAEVPALGLWGPAVRLVATGHAVEEVVPNG